MNSPTGPKQDMNVASSHPELNAALPDTSLGEEAFRRVVEWAPSAMVMINHHGVIVMVNTQTEKMFDYERQALLGQSVEILVPESFREHHPHFRRGFLDDPQPRPMGIGRDLFGCRSDGSEFPVEIGLNPITTEAGTMVLASIIDITERHRAQQHLEDALREKTVLLNEVHHRVKNNLQVIISLLNLQSDFASDTQVKSILAESCSRVKAMALTHQLLYERRNFAQLELGDYLGRLIQSVRASHRGSGTRIGLQFNAPPAGVVLDFERTIPCGLLVNELVTNSFKHAFPDGRTGEIVISLSEDQNEQILLTVSDNGVGLPPETTLAPTSSLGLQLVQLFVEQLHGDLVISSDNGTRFALTFPKKLKTKENP